MQLLGEVWHENLSHRQAQFNNCCVLETIFVVGLVADGGET